MVKSAVASKRVLRPPEVRGANRAAVLSLLQQNDYMSRADVARQSGLSEGAISRIVTGLIDDRLIREDGAENSTGGRPGRRLALERRRLIFGAEIQNWETRCAVSTMNGHIVETRRFRTRPTAEETLADISAEFMSFRKKLGPDRLPGIGVCARGIVNSDTGVLVLGGRPDWHHIPIREILEMRLREPVFVENNVRAAALAEYTYGPAEITGRHCFVFVKMDEGVGMGVLFDGKLYHGPHMAAGEFGQMVIETATGDEGHDRPGCIERLISNAAICDRYAGLTGAWRQPSTGDTSARVRRIAEWATGGDASARQTVEETARYLGVGISNLIWGLDADTVVIDATITEAWGLVEPVLRRQLPDNNELWGSRNLRVRPSVFGGEAALIGAASLPLNKIFAGNSPVQLAIRTAK
ncbi:MAG: ROK family transcriptional regulator [Acidobacteriota bacterium]|nr:ROK family transcriptional regulator [Acidobacteriota bacterium]